MPRQPASCLLSLARHTAWQLKSQNSCSRQIRTAPEASASKLPPNPYPYPAHRNPTPYQIFHLPRNASEAAIKERYIDLVRLYHPDKSGSVSTEVAHERFQAITTAYDILRGKTTLHDSPTSAMADRRYQSTAAWRSLRKRRQELYDSGPVDDSWKDKFILAGVIGTILFVVTHTITTRRAVLSDAVERSRQIASYQSQQRRKEEERLSLEHSDKP